MTLSVVVVVVVVFLGGGWKQNCLSNEHFPYTATVVSLEVEI